MLAFICWLYYQCSRKVFGDLCPTEDIGVALVVEYPVTGWIQP